MVKFKTKQQSEKVNLLIWCCKTKLHQKIQKTKSNEGE